ncbi:UDP-N-acetylmuramoyl-L-alanyl-D-glutamate--2,6-diaminopimelate ligase [Chlorobium phaeovibrioides]|uniref:UDP-N-acetylmuramoyl-L-alanyl-D-glutamate--2,6-diaminopimelate ligase n=1 Tax=Chlorobium phaeovibrioides TaxID=1094 RepID=A0A5M8IG77_CHLPH|nr:UDP-N-acetylmuramoyl-L-alanyl-D-glutamate--2,6-diaminopimelate ligase [Chlorobium phaeovibrioides]KAA6233289.1 UDP-N-acetylmuramoyl-L-alanyl-D-glutamate--2,6-diaminopimelate ligase [Chlorobium phaeovibrioides]
MSTSLPVSRLLDALTAPEILSDAPCRGSLSMISSDSRDIEQGGLFVAVRGFQADGHDFVADAVSRGAAAVICEEFPGGDLPPGVCFIKVPDARLALAEAAFALYGGASKQLDVIGVSGTNGKTTTAMLIAAMLNHNGIRCGYIGTGRAVIGDEEIPLERTTPEAHGLQRLLRRMVDEGCRAVAMEVSSHALMLQRVHGVRFRVAVFTNLTVDHLDFHGSMEAYASAKQRLFRQLLPEGRAVLNMDDPRASFMAEGLPPASCSGCSLSGVERRADWNVCGEWFLAEVTGEDAQSSHLRLSFPDGMFDGELLLPGRFNVMNALLAAATCHAMGVSGGAAAASFPFLPPVQGRMERVDGGPGRVRAIVDYAHTPDALQRVLQTLARLKPVGGRLAVVFGCGGDRDASKRPVMGRIAEELADMVILTSDNPRSEDPERILDDIEQGMSCIGHRRIADRGTAISTAVAELGELDILLVAGKGRESYQESMGKRVFFSDREFLLNSLGADGRMPSAGGEGV